MSALVVSLDELKAHREGRKKDNQEVSVEGLVPADTISRLRLAEIAEVLAAAGVEQVDLPVSMEEAASIEQIENADTSDRIAVYPLLGEEYVTTGQRTEVLSLGAEEFEAYLADPKGFVLSKVGRKLPAHSKVYRITEAEGKPLDGGSFCVVRTIKARGTDGAPKTSYYACDREGNPLTGKGHDLQTLARKEAIELVEAGRFTEAYVRGSVARESGENLVEVIARVKRAKGSVVVDYVQFAPGARMSGWVIKFPA